MTPFFVRFLLSSMLISFLLLPAEEDAMKLTWWGRALLDLAIIGLALGLAFLLGKKDDADDLEEKDR